MRSIAAGGGQFYVSCAVSSLDSWDRPALGWRSDVVQSFDCEFGYSTMGYEIAAAATQSANTGRVVTLTPRGD